MKISLGKQTSNVEVQLSPNFCISTFMYLYLRQTVEVVASSQPPVPRILLLYHHPSHWAKFSSKFPLYLIFQKSVQNWPKIALSKLQPLQNHNFLTWREIQMVFCPRCQYCSQCNSHHTSLYVTTSTPCTLSCHTIKAECFLEFGLGL